MNKIKLLRLEKRLTQKELAEKAKTNYATLSRMESGIQSVNEDVVKNLTSFFNVSADYLLGISDIRTPHEPFGIPNQKVLDELGDDQELIKTFHELIGREDTALLFHKMKTMTPQDAKKVLKIIKAIEDEESEGK